MTTQINQDELLDNSLFIEQLVAAGFSESEAAEVLEEADTMGIMPDDARAFQKHFRNESGGVSIAKVDAFMHIQNTKMTLDSYMPVLQDRADNTDHETKLEGLRNAINIMHAAGYSGQKIADTLNSYVKISKSFTPHPTEGLSRDGIRLTRKLVRAAEERVDIRPQELQNVVREIASSKDFGASKKSNMLDETDYSSKCARIHNEGVNELDRQVERIIYETTGDHVDVLLNTGARSWDYDADGKNNAEGFAMMMKMATTTMDAMNDLSANLALASTGSIPVELRDELTTLKHNVDGVMQKLKPVYDRSRAITRELAEAAPDQREMIYRQHYDKEFQELFTQLSQIYDDQDGRRGLDFYEKTVSDLDRLRKELVDHDADSTLAIDDAYRTTRRNGFALEKGQTRHNDYVYIDMLDNMLDPKNDAFWGMGILSKKDRDEVFLAGKFSNLPTDVQYLHWERILDHAKKNGNRDDLIHVLESSNQLNFKAISDGGNGYPDQEQAYVDRMKLRALFPFKFEEGIISDAQEIGSPRQKFIADLFGMVHMKHMSLNEDPANLAQQPTLVRKFNESGGSDNMENRLQKMPDLFRRLHQTLHIMRPASDAEKVGGSFTRLQAIDQYRGIVREAYDMKVPVEVMIGGGQSLNRFGGDVDMVRRVLAQELKDKFLEKQENGESLDEYDEKMIIMATSILYTEQGRTKRYASASSEQVMDDFAGKLTNIIQDYVDLKGHTPDHAFIDKRRGFSPEMDKLQRIIADRGILEYETFNKTSLKDKLGQPTDALILDNYTEKAGIPNQISSQNNGARPEAGKAKGGSKKTSSLRAIGKDQTLYSMQSFHAGFFASGGAMERFYDALHDGKIGQDDIDDLMHNEDWDEAIFSRNLIDAGRFNATHLFEKLSDGDASAWKFDRVMQIGEEVVWQRDPETEKITLRYEGDEDVTQEQLYLSKIYYDRAVFLAMTEAALTPKGQGVTMNDSMDDIIKSIRPENNSLEFGLGERTNAHWPAVEETLTDHRKNAPAYAVVNMVEEDIQGKLDAGIAKDDVMAEYGEGDPANADPRFRQYGSALRAGTLPHKGKWTGRDTYGIKNRTDPDIDMPAIMAYAQSHGDPAEQLRIDFE